MKMKNKWKKALEMYLYFFRIGWFTFGGGWSIVAQIQKDYVEGKKEISSEDLLDFVSVGRSLPGVMICNIAYIFGNYQAGAVGGLLALLGIATPPVIILTAITFCYTNVKDNVYVAGALKGVRAAVAPIIFSAALKLRHGAYPNKLCYLITIIGCIGTFYFGISCVWFIIFGAVMGLVMSSWEKSAGTAGSEESNENKENKANKENERRPG